MVNIEEHIEVNPKIMMGKPVIKGTRISVSNYCLKSFLLVKPQMKYLKPIPI